MYGGSLLVSISKEKFRMKGKSSIRRNLVMNISFPV
jgi:hypothetical protein